MKGKKHALLITLSVLALAQCMKSNVKYEVGLVEEKITANVSKSLKTFFYSDIAKENLLERTEKLPFSIGVNLTKYDDEFITQLANTIIEGKKGDVVSVYGSDGEKIAVGVYWRLTGVEYTASSERKQLIENRDIFYSKKIDENLYIYQCKR